MKKNLYPLTEPQKSIWWTEQLISNNSLNNISGNILINDIVNFELLEKALNYYVQKNEAIRLRITMQESQPMQYVSKYIPFHINVKTIQNELELEQLNHEIVKKPFSLIDSDLYYFELFKYPNGTGGLHVKFHHIISDAWTMSLFINESMEIYNKLLRGEVIDTSPNYSYLDFITSETTYLSSSRYKKDEQFWHDKLNFSPEFCSVVPAKKNTISTKAKRKIYQLDKNLYKSIYELCKIRHCSMYTFFMAIYSLYIAKLSQTIHPIIGTPVLNRTSVKEKQTAGMYISTVPFPIEIEKDMCFNSFLSSVGNTQLSIFRHQKYPYSLIAEYTKKTHQLSENLYDIVLSYQNAKDDCSYSNVSYTTKWLFSGELLDTLAIHFYDMDNSGIFDIYYDYQIKKLTEKEVNSIHLRILSMINQVLQDPNIPLKDIEIVTHEEKQDLLQLNNTDYDSVKEHSILEIFQKQVIKYEKKDAIIFENKSTNYKELDEKSNQLANFLLNQNIGKNKVIGIMLPRSINLLTCVLGILKSGNGYMLIDPELPQDRICYMSQNCICPLLITNHSLSNINFSSIVELENISLNDYSKKSLPITNNHEDIFCVIYTSGSTGKPKGVELNHLGIVNLLLSFQKNLNILDCNYFLSTSTISFDMFIVENFMSLLSGKTVVLANEEEQKIPILMSKLMTKYCVDFIVSTPSKIELLLDEKTNSCLKYLKVIQLGGEVFTENLYKKLSLYTDANIHNGYGPSECTACCSNKEIQLGNNITIGKPFLNTKIFICNQDMNLLPIGFTGEICISGYGVANGYNNNQELTNKSFLPNPFGNGRIYKTGDIGKYNADGELEYIGRKDLQIKLHGLRIELNEITNELKKLPFIKQAVTIIQKVNFIDCICSYIVSSSTSEKQIKDCLSKKLPYYMVPSHIVFLDKLPLTLNGKIDKNALPAITIKDSDSIKPTTPTQIELSNLWKKVLKLDSISINSNFFDLGGDSLCLIKLISEIYSKFNIHIPMKEFFNYPTISDLAGYIDLNIDKSKKKNISIQKAKIKPYYPLSSAQKRIYYTVTSEGKKSTTYNTPGGILFDKIPDIKKLEKSIEILINRHQSLHAYFTIEENNLVQKLKDNITFSLKIEKGESKNLNRIFENFLKPFELDIAPLIHAKLVLFENSSAILLLDFHHIICDGTSISVLIDELSKLYKNETLDSISLDYIDFAVWEQTAIEKKSNYPSKLYWTKRLSGELPILNMPTVFPRPAVKSIQGAKVYEQLDSCIKEKVFNLAKKLNSTPYMLFLSVYYILLYKYTNQEDIIVGSPIVGRDCLEVSSVVGMFANTLALKQNIDSSDTFSMFLTKVTKNCLSDFEHQQYPFDELIKDLNIQKDPSRTPLFSTMFIYQNEGDPILNFKDLNASYYIPDSHTSKFDFSLEVKPMQDTFSLTFEYCTKLYDSKFMDRFAKHYCNLLTKILNQPDEILSNLDILTFNEQKQILNEFNRTENYCDIPLLQIYQNNLDKNLDNTAIICDNKSITYREFEQKSNQIASTLLKYSISENSVVAILCNRSEVIPMAMFGILKAGLSYLIIDPELPRDRIEYMLTIANVSFLLAQKDISFNGVNTLLISSIENSEFSDFSINNSTNLSVVFTSGSTGMPKGVCLKRDSMAYLVHCYDKFIHTEEYKNFISTCSIAFDMFAVEIFIPLLTGKTLILATNKEYKDPSYISSLISNYSVDFMLITPSKLELLLLNDKTSKCLSTLKNIQLGGESLTVNLYEKLKTCTNAIIGNEYGPTETTACATFNEIQSTNNLSIGKPFPNIAIYICNKDGNLCPIGVPGELCICGSGVSYGYINNEDATKKSFIPNPFGNGLLYKTGDIAKYEENGDIIYIGRNDFQIKIHGLRVELNEIEKQIESIPDIKNCICVYHDSTREQYIAAFYTSDKKMDTNTIKSFLIKKLPFYMIPKNIIQLDSMPLTLTGKIDKKKLINYTPKVEESNNTYIPPITEKQKLICNILENLLGTRVGLEDNIFDLGIDSLLALKFKIELLSYDIELDYAQIFQNPIVKDLCNISSKNKLINECIDHKNESIDSLLKNNKIHKQDAISYNSSNNVLLLGANGFVGIHILYQFLKNDSGNIYCIIRDKDGLSATDRFLQILHFYFDNELDSYIGNRLFIIRGDITCNNFDLSTKDYKTICENTSIVINSAANVKHFGHYDKFYKINVEATQKIADFCIKHKKRLLHISSLSVSGNSLADNSHVRSNLETTFSEKDLFINQSLENVYIRSKFEAEKIVLSNIVSNMLDAKILRLGNITNRFTDGKFQINPDSNAFLVRLKCLFNIGIIPEYLLEHYLEFTPVDICGSAIIAVMQHNCPKHSIYHIYNANHLPIKTFLEYVNNNNVRLDIVSQDIFAQTIRDILSDSNKDNMLSGIINDLTSDYRLLYNSSIKIDSKFTLSFLDKIGFRWPIIDQNYITKYMDYIL